MERFTNLMNGLECHFNWNIREIVGEKDIVEKLSEKNEEIAGLPWRNLLITLTTAYEMYLKQDSGANHKLQEAITMWIEVDDNIIMKYKDAFRHVIFSLKLFFIKDSSSLNIVKELFEYIPPLSTLPTEQKAAIKAIKAHIFSEYGPNGTKHALILAKEAVKENPTEGEWSFLVGKMLSRIRNFTKDQCVSEEELECLRHAYSLSKSPPHAVFLAQTYATIAKALFQKLPMKFGRRIPNVEENKIMRGYNEKAYNLFRDALTENDNKCVHINFRCARGLFYLPCEFKDTEKALDIVVETLERAPSNVYGNSIACNIFYALKQYDKAFKCADAAEKGGSFGMSLKKIHMKVEQKMEIDTEKEYESLIEGQTEMMYKIQAAMHAIGYYIFMKRQLFLALKYFFKAADWDAKLDDFYCYVYWIKESTDLCFIVYNEVKCTIDKRKATNPKQLKQLRDAITIISSTYPSVTERKLDERLVEFLMKRVQRPQGKRFNRNPKNFNRNRNVERTNKSENVNQKNDKMPNNRQNKHPNKKNGGRMGRCGSRKRNDSESSNASCASNASFSRIRRNSKESCLLNIISKDMEIANRCEEVKKGYESLGASLRPSSKKNEPLLGFEANFKKSLSLGCSGWNSKSKSHENLGALKNDDKRNKNNDQKLKQQNKDSKQMSQLNEMFNKMNVGHKSFENRPNRSFSPFENRPNRSFSPFENRPNRSFSPFENRPNRSLGFENRPNRSLGFENNFTSENGKMRRSLSVCSESSLDKKNYSFTAPIRSDAQMGGNKQFNRERNPPDRYREDTQNYRKSVSSRESSRDRYNQSGAGSSRNYYNQNRNAGYNNGRGGKQTNRTTDEQRLVRKPFNLNKRDSLDSDDSLSARGSQCDLNFDRLSTSSVDSDYVRDSSKTYFPWHKKSLQ